MELYSGFFPFLPFFSVSFHCIFNYLEDRTLQEDKTGMWQCLQAVTNQVFKTFLNVMAQRKRNSVWEAELEAHAQVANIPGPEKKIK